MDWKKNTRIWWCCIWGLVWCGFFLGVSAEEIENRNVKLAAEARLDLMAEPDVGELKSPRLVIGDGDAVRMNWIKPEDRPRSITVEFIVSPLGWRPFEVTFTPTGSGDVQLQLRGAWQQGKNEQVLKQEVLWDALKCDGAELANGSFETVEMGIPQGWQGSADILIAASERVPAVDGSHFAKTWHDVELSTRLNVAANRTVKLSGFSRAVIPDGFRELARGTTGDTPAHRAAKRFLRGVNFGNFLEVSPTQTWALPHRAEDLQHVHQEGFDHVRLPIGWHHYTGPAPEYQLKPDIFRKVDGLVAEARRLGLGLILNVHHFDEFTSHPDQQRRKFVSIWRQVAEHYSSDPDNLTFELLNEPKDAATTTVMNEIYAEVIREIRRSNPTRTIFVGPGDFNSADELFALRLPDDDWNLITTVHCYSPMYFTHQGANWTGPDFALTGVRFPGPPNTPIRVPMNRGFQSYVIDWMDKYNQRPAAENPSGPRAFAETIQRAKEWSDYYGRPIHFGEFGAYEKADPDSRAHYYRAIRQRLEKEGIGWAAWDWKAGFRYWNSRTDAPEPGMREALFGK